MFKTILIDDEKLAISRLERLLSKYTDTFEIIDHAHNGAEGLLKIESQKPDLIFLDIEMPMMTGFEMLSHLSYMPMIVFATAYDEYAIKAFEENSIDYLLKPIEADRLEITIQKLQKVAKNHSETKDFGKNLMQILEQMKPKKEINAISVKSGNKILLIALNEISYFEAEDKYVFLITLDGNKYLTSYTIANLEEKLPDYFIRVSRAVIIHSHFVKELEKHFNGKYMITMRDKSKNKINTGSSFSDNIKKLFEL